MRVPPDSRLITRCLPRFCSHSVSGGGFDSGASSDPKIDGSFMAAKDIVFASYNYRLSLWAWPHAAEIAEARETQNFGLLDTRAAVEWMKANARAFGGDPEKIVLGGEHHTEVLYGVEAHADMTGADRGERWRW